jgi:opacity protein-like surface antigen
MKRYFLLLVSAVLLAASQGARTQLFDGSGAENDWELRFGSVFTESKNLSFHGGSTVNLKGDWGLKIGAGYYLTDQLIIGGNFSWGRADFNGYVKGTNAAVAFEGGRITFNTWMFDATYVLFQGPIKPYGVLGVGWSWTDTNIATGPPQTGCWWDPWWGYVCSGYQPTKGSSSLALQAGAGVQFNFSPGFAIDIDYRYSMIDLHNESSKPGVGVAQLMFIWRPGY